MDDASWIMGFMDIIDPAIDSIKRLLNLNKVQNSLAGEDMQFERVSGDLLNGSGFDLDEFIRQKLSLDPSKIEIRLSFSSKTTTNVWRSENKNVSTPPKL